MIRINLTKVSPHVIGEVVIPGPFSDRDLRLLRGTQCYPWERYFGIRMMLVRDKEKGLTASEAFQLLEHVDLDRLADVILAEVTGDLPAGVH